MESATLRVLVTAFAPVPGSSPHAGAVQSMAQALHAEVDIITLKTEQLSHLDKLGEARLFRVPVGMGTPVQQMEAFRRAVHRQMDAQPYDVVHVRGPLEGLAAVARRADLGFRFVYEIASFPDESDGPETETAWGAAHQQCLDAADLVLVSTRAAERELGERGYAGKVAVVSPGVDVATFDWWPQAPSESARLLYLGTFGADRDLGTMLGAVKLLVKRLPIRMLVAGDPDHERRERVRRMVDGFDLGEHVEVRGEPRPETIPALIAAADLCLAPAAATPRFQDWGDLPQPLLEYFACGRPVVAAGVPGVAEVMRDEQEGLLYPPGEEQSLCDAINTMLSEDALREKVVQAAYDRVRQKFSGGARRRRIAEVYEALSPGSQRWDAWSAGFDSELTGQISVPNISLLESLPDTGERNAASGRPEGDTGESHAMAGSVGPFDTSPGLDTPEDSAPMELSSQPTQKLQVDTLPGLDTPGRGSKSDSIDLRDTLDTTPKTKAPAVTVPKPSEVAAKAAPPKQPPPPPPPRRPSRPPPPKAEN